MEQKQKKLYWLQLEVDHKVDIFINLKKRYKLFK